MHRLALVAVAAFFVPVSPALAAESRTALSGPLTKLAQRDVRTAPRAERARLLSLPPSGPGSLVQSGGDVVVDVRAGTTSAAQVERLRAAGARIVHVAGDLRTITVAVAPAELSAVAAVPGVENVSPELMPETSASGAAPTCQGSIVSEADGQLRAALGREEFGVTGAGVKVGVLSDSYDVNAADARNAVDGVASGDLTGDGNPCGQTAPVEVLAEGPPDGTDEGRGMLELVHDVAPGAALAFASAVPETAFPARVAALHDAGADVLVDDVGFFDEPFFQPGPADAAIEAARGAGSAYFTAAGNFNVMAGGQNRSSWEAPAWRSTTCPTGLPDGYTGCMQLAMGVAPGARLRLAFQWAEPWFGVDGDLDVFLVSGSAIVAASGLQNNGENGTQKPFEFLSWLNGGASQANVSLVIAKFGSTPAPGPMKAILGGGAAFIGTAAPEDRYGPTIFGHNGAAGAMSVAAVPFSDGSQVETFSSRGPVTHYFGPVSGDESAAALSVPQTLAKPDIAATDGTFTSFFPANGASRFFGTSAAAPHAAAVAALQMEAEPEATVDEVYDIQRATARQVGTFGPDARGAGLLDAYAALDRITQGPPIPRTNAATGITGAAATLPGSVNPHRLATTARFEYATGGAAPTSTPDQPIGSGRTNVDVSAAISGLLPNATYTYRVVAANSAGTSRGEDRMFTTATIAPLAQTGAADAITATGASLAGTADPQGTATTARFEYGTTTGYGAETAAQAVGSGRAAVDVSAELAGLQPATTYHYRLVTTNSAGTTRGADRTFTTSSAPPTATTGAASAITTTGATLAGTADPRGTGTSVHFEWGPTSGYGNQTATQDIGSGRAPVDLTAALSNLQPSTTYHYRIVASNSAGTTAGPDRTITTARRPTVSAPPPVRQAVPPAAASPAATQRTIALTVSGRTLQLTGASHLARAAVKVRRGKRTLANKRLRLRSGAATVRLRWSDVRNGRSLTVSLGGSTVRLDLQSRRVRVMIGGGFTRATVQIRRRSRTLADGVLQPPSRALSLRFKRPRQPRSDRVVVVVQGP